METDEDVTQRRTQWRPPLLHHPIVRAWYHLNGSVAAFMSSTKIDSEIDEGSRSPWNSEASEMSMASVSKASVNIYRFIFIYLTLGDFQGQIQVLVFFNIYFLPEQG